MTTERWSPTHLYGTREVVLLRLVKSGKCPKRHSKKVRSAEVRFKDGTTQSVMFTSLVKISI